MTRTATRSTMTAPSSAPTGNLPATVRPIDQFKTELTARQSMLRPMLPAHVTFEKFQAAVIAAVGSNPKLLECTRPSLFKACVEIAELGLSLNPSLGEADILPVWNGRIKAQEAQARPRYMGLMKLARQSGEIVDIYAHEVRAGDHFDYELGLNKRLEHKPAAKRGELTHAYVVWQTKDGVKSFEVMDKEQILAIKARSSAKNRDGQTVGPWVSDESEMWRKTAVRRGSKYMPRSAEAFQRAVSLDNAREFGADADIVDGEVIVADDITEPMTDTAASEPADQQLDGLEARMGGAAQSPAVQQADIKVITVPEVDGHPDWKGWADAVISAIGKLTTSADLDRFATLHKPVMANCEFNSPDQAARVTAAAKEKRKAP